MNRKMIVTIVWAISTIVFFGSLIVNVPGLKIEHFEDGSGRITYCLPTGICQLPADYSGVTNADYAGISDSDLEAEYQCRMTLAERGELAEEDIIELCQP